MRRPTKKARRGPPDSINDVASHTLRVSSTQVYERGIDRDSIKERKGFLQAEANRKTSPESRSFILFLCTHTPMFNPANRKVRGHHT
jgi:hypothetical protein